ncbi:hypothetical protein SCP_0300240 [Sparassis crispa]|uniref:Uncharacterized protein n=1 Tax=Sparassis crispa TaxID=139825 RepID=A0A401GDQ5_9APHY|nr:hypothetical protein SCP_0300240 [Sparassis crispa]GBE80309.1 hypothetical protein SCP_0300240 [Sparassis crispa]
MANAPLHSMSAFVQSEQMTPSMRRRICHTDFPHGIFVLIILPFAVLLPHLVGLLLAFLLLLVLIFAFVCHFLVAPSGSRGHNVTHPAGHSILPCILCRCSSVDRLNTPFIVLFTLFGLPRHLLIPNSGPCYRNLTRHARSPVLARTFRRS